MSDNKDIKNYIEDLTKEKIVSLWGQESKFKPEIVPDSDGDGLQFIFVQTITQRPKYWIVRVDSLFGIGMDFAGDDWDKVELPLEIIEAYYGMFDPSADDDPDIDDEGDYEPSDIYPRLNSDCGWDWWVEANFGKFPDGTYIMKPNEI